MNRKLLCAVLAAGAAMFATGAIAADLPTAAPPPAPYIPPPPVFTWTGFYVGVNAGVAFMPSPIFDPLGIGGAVPLHPGLSSTAGFTGGGEAGYNWEVNQFVFGVEGDVDYLNDGNFSGTFASPFGVASSYTLSGGHTNGTIYGTIRGRLGWAVDRALFYVTGGAAFGGNSWPTTIAFTNGTLGCFGAGCILTRTSNNNVGAVVGGGLEYAFTPNWTAKVEYLHTFYGHATFVDNVVGTQEFVTSNGSLDNNIVRVGLNYKF